MKHLHLLCALLACLCLTTTLAQVSKLSTLPFSSSNSYQANFRQKIGDKLFFVASTSAFSYSDSNRKDLWVSDGTPVGTYPLDATSINLSNIQVVGNQLFFQDFTALWRLNAQTLEKTKILDATNISNLIVKDTELYFTAYDSLKICYIYTYNTLTNNLKKVSKSSPISINIYGLKAWAFNKNVLAYWSYDYNSSLQISKYTLWRTDGSASGTYKLDSFAYVSSNIYSFKDRFYFNAIRAFQQGVKVESSSYQTDGQSAAQPLNQNFSFSEGVFTDKGFVGAILDTTGGKSLHFSDFSTASATLLIKYAPHQFVKLNDKIYFFAITDASLLAFYETDGTRNGTKLLTSFVNRSSLYSSADIRNIRQANGKIFAEILTPQYGSELFVSDGTMQGTFIEDVWKGSGGSCFWEKTRAIGSSDKGIYFEAHNGKTGFEVWWTGDSPNSAKQVTNFEGNNRYSYMSFIGSINDKMLFLNKIDTLFGIWAIDEKQPVTPKIEPVKSGYDWLSSIGTQGFSRGSNEVNVESIQSDKNQNTYILGKYRPQFAFSDTVLFSDYWNNYRYAAFITKYDKKGNVLWHKNLLRTNFEANNMATDTEGNVYAVLEHAYLSTFTKPDSVFIDSQLVYQGYDHPLFIVKFDTNGKLIWTKKLFINSYFVYFKSIIVKNQTVCIVGNTTINGRIDDKSIAYGTFAIKLADNGTTLWAGLITDDYKTRIIDAAMDTEGHLISLYAKIDNTAFFVTKSDKTTGNVLWSQNLPLSNDSKITVNSDNNIWILTNFGGKKAFGNRSVVTDKPNGLATIVLNANGEVVRTLVLDNQDILLPIDITFDKNNRVTIAYYRKKSGTARYQYPTWDIDNKRSLVIKQLSNLGLEIVEKEIFTYTFETERLLGNFDTEGGFVWAAHDVPYVDTIPNIPLSENFYVLSRCQLRPILSDPQDDKLAATAVIVSPNPSTNFLTVQSEDGDFTEVNLSVFNILGQPQHIRTIHKEAGFKTIDVSRFLPGTYILIIQKGNDKFAKKFVKL